MLNYNNRTVNTIIFFVSLVICLILFIILDSCILNIPNNKNEQNISVSFMNIKKINEPNRKDLDSIKIQDVFLELMQVADIYDDPNIRIDEIETGEDLEEQTEEGRTDESTLSNNYENSENESVLSSYTYVNSKWRIEIPKIGLIAPIKTGTTQEVLATAVGHFEGSSSWTGNIPLAGHNRGYNCNFFANIKNLETGDKIIYFTKKGKREYKVVTNKIIKQTDWSYVADTVDNRITLITCVENMHDYRRCVQAVEI